MHRMARRPFSTHGERSDFDHGSSLSAIGRAQLERSLRQFAANGLAILQPD
jgi:hypothetical protein